MANASVSRFALAGRLVAAAALATTACASAQAQSGEPDKGWRQLTREDMIRPLPGAAPLSRPLPPLPPPPAPPASATRATPASVPVIPISPVSPVPAAQPATAASPAVAPAAAVPAPIPAPIAPARDVPAATPPAPAAQPKAVAPAPSRYDPAPSGGTPPGAAAYGAAPATRPAAVAPAALPGALPAPMPAASTLPGSAQLGGASSPGATDPLLSGVPQQPGGTKLNVGAVLRATATSNGNLAPADTRRKDVIGEISPYVRGEVDSPNAKGYVGYMLRGFVRAHDTAPNELRHDFRALGDLALGTPQLRLSSTAYLFDVNSSPFLVNAADPSATPSANRVRYKRFDISPYYVGQAGSTEYQVRYRALVADDLVPGVRSTDHALSAFVRSGDTGAPLGWATTGQVNRRIFENDYQYGYASFATTVYVPLGRDARFGVSANYAKVDIVLDSRGRNHGWGPGLAFDWVPSDRTALTLVAARQYYGGTGSLRFVHRSPTWTVGLNAHRQLLTSSDSSIVYLDPGQQFGTQRAGTPNNPVIESLVRQNLLNPTGFLLAAAPAGAALQMDRRFTAMFGIVGQQNALLFSGFSVTRDMLPLTAEAVAGLPVYGSGLLIDQRGFTATYSRSLSPVSAMYVRALVGDSLTGDTRARLTTYALGYRTLFTPQIGGTAEIRHSQQRTTGGLLADIDENAVAVAVDIRY